MTTFVHFTLETTAYKSFITNVISSRDIKILLDIQCFYYKINMLQVEQSYRGDDDLSNFPKIQKMTILRSVYLKYFLRI